MIKTEKEYQAAMRSMILRVQNNDEPDDAIASIEEMELLSDCIKAGYISGYTKLPTGNDMRTGDGKMHPLVINNVITPKGLAFLKPNKTEFKSNLALAISLAALLVSFLANLGKIIENIEIIKKLFHG